MRRGVTWTLAGQILFQVIRPLTVAVLARLLTPGDYGGGVAIVAAANGAGAWALALQQIAFMGTFVAAIWFRAGWRPTLEFSRPVFRELSSFAIRIAGGRWARLIELLLLTLLIGGLASVSELGAWSFGMSMVILPLSLIAIPIAEVRTDVPVCGE